MDNSTVIYNYYKAKGLNNNQIAGIMGNIQQESNFDSTATNSSSGAYGIFQWLGSRKSELQKFAKARGTSSDDLMTQLDFSWQEMNSTEKKTLNMLNENKYSSARTIARLFESTYERSGGSAVAKRQEYASNWLNSFGGVTGGTGNSSSGGTVDIQTGIDGTNELLGNLNTDSNIDLTLSGNILKFTSILLIAILCVVFLVLTLKKTAMSGVVDIGKDILKDTIKGVSKGGGESE